MERNLTQREYEELNSRREAAGRPPLSYRDANRQARRPTTRQRQARQQGGGPEGSRTEVSSETRARPPTPPRPKRQRDERGSSSQTYTWTGDWWNQDWGAWSWQDTHWWEHQESAATATEADPPEMEAQQTDTVHDDVWQLDQMEISTDEEECSPGATTSAATGSMEGGVSIDPTDLFEEPLTVSDLPEDSSKAEKLSKMMTAALRHKPGDFQIELQPDGFVRLETLAQSAQFRKQGATSRMLAAVVRSISKKRFMFTMRRGDIHVAATHGHSEGVLITQDTLVELSQSRAPEFAYHATKFSHWHGILSRGLLKMGRTHVHLAVQPTQQEGLRGGQDLLIVVRCQDLVKSGIRLYRTATNVLLTPGVTTGGLLPLHFIHEVRNIQTGEVHYKPPVAGDDSLWLAEGRLPPMPGQRMSGDAAQWNEPTLWSHVRRRWLMTAPSMGIELHPAQFIFSFLTARGLKNQLSMHGDVMTDENNQIWHGVRVTDPQDLGTASSSASGTQAMYHGTHLFALASAVKTGMRASSSQDGTRTLHKGGAPLEGVYSMTKITQVLFYCPYVLVPLRAEGRADSIAAVRVVVELAAEPSSNQRLGKRTNQWILNERLVSIAKIWGQVCSPDHLTPGDAYTSWDSKLEAAV